MDKVAVQETLPPCHESYKGRLALRTHMVPMQSKYLDQTKKEDKKDDRRSR